jgi:hypothetical protein
LKAKRKSAAAATRAVSAGLKELVVSAKKCQQQVQQELGFQALPFDRAQSVRELMPVFARACGTAWHG